jgi:hypothetical protein
MVVSCVGSTRPHYMRSLRRFNRLLRFPYPLLPPQPQGLGSVSIFATGWPSRTLMASCALVLAFGLGACGNTDSPARSMAPEGEAGQGEVRASCTDCSITFGPEVVIGDREDHHVGFPIAGALVDGQHHIIIASIDRIQVFDADGEVVRSIGRTGDGPGEFRRVRGIVAGPDDSLFVFHGTGVSVFDREGEFARQVAFPDPPTRPIRLESGEFVSNTPPGRGQYGSSFYVYDSQFERHTYGTEVGQVPSNSALAGPILTGSASGGGFWIAASAPYRFERWTSAGQLEVVLEPSADHFPVREHTQIVGAGRQVTTNTPYVTAVGEDQEGRLWISVAELVEEGGGDLPPSGLRVESIIEVRDPRTGDLLGTGRVRGYVSRIQPDGHVLATWEAPSGEQLWIVRRAHVEGR